MQLKSLEMQGFKSFADRTEFKFDPGITGIVGPNGCGKSNVVDAIKWVLGDLSAKSIRGEDMLDCIFNGASSRAASGFAEVSLTFDNTDGKLPTEFSEVTVTRRLFRSGESEYLINKQPARRKDILDLFMDTGVGTDAYSIIEQGRIGVVLEASPKERRALIDEAAGISRYRARKKESTSRLERVDQDLLRLGDTLKELETQVRSLKIQAGKAERYVKMKDEWKDKRTLLTLLSYDSLRAQADALALRLTDAESERERVAATIASFEEDAATARAAEDEALATFHATSARREGIAKEEAGCERSIEEAESLAGQMEAQARREREAVESAKEEESALKVREEAARGALSEAEAELARIGKEIEARQEAWKGAEEAARGLARERDEKKKETLSALDKRGAYRNEAAGVEAHRHNLAAQRARAEEKTERLRGESAQLDEKLRGVMAEKVAIEADVERMKAENRAAEKVQDEAKAAAHEAAKALGEKREVHARASAKLETLKDIERQMEGLGAGAKRLLEAARKGQAAGFRGLVADLIEFDPATALAAEAILGDRAQAAVFDSVEAMRAGLAMASGRVALMSLDRFRPGRIVQTAESLCAPGADFEPERAGETAEGDPMRDALAEALDADFEPGSYGWNGPVIDEVDADFFAAFTVPTGPELVEQMFPDKPPSGLLFEFATCSPELRPLAAAMCGKARIVATRDEALAMLAEGKLEGPAATLDGDVVHPDGLVIAGGARAGLIRRRAEARTLAAEIEKLTAEVVALGEERSRRAAEETEAAARCTALRLEVLNRSHDSIEKRTEADGMEKRLNVLRGELEMLEREDADARSREVSLAERGTRLEELLADLESLLAKLNQESEALAEQAAAAGEACEEAKRALNELKVAQAEAQGRRQSASQSVAEAGRQIQAARNAASQASVRLAECEERHKAAVAGVEERRARLDDLRRDLEAASAAAAEAESAREVASRAAREATTRKHAAENELRSAEQALNELRIEVNTVRVNEENLVARFRDELGVDLREAEKALPRDPAASADSLGREVEELRRRIDSMGGVNPEAIHELKEREERYAYLKGQEQDLVASKGQLEELIRKINRESRELLVTTLEQTRINFNEVFRKLFGGGKAEIVTEEGTDILDCGIDLMAKPPGKEPATISQLSGGEKTLTVLAFIMALFQLRPSPFCILDEVDAPLDESNVERYNHLIRDFATGTQFIVITHNKKTMTGVDAMYGVTMQEKGISKKISVQIVDKGAAHAEPELAGAAT